MQRKIMGAFLAGVIGLALVGAVARAGEPKGEGKLGEKLIGTWKAVSAKYGGKDVEFPDRERTLKHITPAQFMWVSYDADGKVTRAAGGSYTLKDGIYEETPEYGISSDFDVVKGKAQTFRCRIEGNKWYHEGKLSNGLEIEEVWERVQRAK